MSANYKPQPAGDAPPLSSLKRWSQRKHAARRDAESVADPSPLPVTAASAGTAPQAPAPSASDPAALPPVETLTPESDFTRFFDAKTPVDDTLKRAALKALLRDPRFNIMDGLDTYIDDYTRPDPIPEGVLQRLVHAQSFVTPSPETPAAVPAAAAAEPAQLGSDTDPAAAASPVPAAASLSHAADAPSTDAPASPTGKPTT